MLGWASLLATSTVGNPFADWPIQLAFAVPFVVALGWVGKKLWDRMDRIETQKDELSNKVINDFAKTIIMATAAMEASTRIQEETMAWAKDVRQELSLERTLRVRLEERARVREDDLDDMDFVHRQKKGTPKGDES